MRGYGNYEDVCFLASFLRGKEDFKEKDDPSYKTFCNLGLLTKGFNPVSKKSEAKLSRRGVKELDLLIHNLSLWNKFKIWKILNIG